MTAHGPILRRLLLGLLAACLILSTSPAKAADDPVAGSCGPDAAACAGNPAPVTLPPGAVDCTPRRDGSALPTECTTPVTGAGSDQASGLDLDDLPGITVTPGAARSATLFDLSAVIAALGPYASAPIFYVDFGDGTGFGNSGAPRALTSFPSSHVYVRPGTYAVTGYATFEGRTESTTMSVTVGPSGDTEQALDKATSSAWTSTQAPKADAVLSVSSASSGGVSVGTASSTVSERMSPAPVRVPGLAPKIQVKTGQTTVVSVPRLPAEAKVRPQITSAGGRRTLPATLVDGTGILTLPALTFAKPGTYTIKLVLPGGAARYVSVKVAGRAKP